MPQFDSFTLPSTLLYFVICFSILLMFNFTHLLPRLSAILKLRDKLVKQTEVINTNIISLQDKIVSFSSNTVEDLK